MSGIFSSIFSPPKQTATTTPTDPTAQFVNQLTPQGNQIYGTYNNGQFTPNANANTLQVQNTPFQDQLTAGGQQLSLGLLNSLQQQGGGNLSTVRSANDIQSSLPQLSQDFSGDAAKVGSASYTQAANRLQPQFTLQQNQLQQRLADQGLPPGSPAYQQAMDQLAQQQNNQLGDLSLGSVSLGYNQSNQMQQQQAANQNQLYNQGQGYANLENQARASQFGQLGSLLGFSQPFTQYTTPQVQTGSTTVTTGGANTNAAALGQVAGLAAVAASDINMKEDIKYLRREKGHKIYEFRYKGLPEKYIGVMAQEVQKINPAAVIKDAITGFLKVNYSLIGIDFKRA